jgi:hypothetical protein
MNAVRLALSVVTLAAVAGCADVVAPSLPDEALSAPVALAKPEMASQTICSAPFFTQLSYDGITWIRAFAAGPLDAPYGTLIPGSQWIGPYPNSGIVLTPAGTYFFRTTFTVPENVHQGTLTALVHADNQATFYLNGKRIFEQEHEVAYPNFQDPVDAFTARRHVEQSNEVVIELVNSTSEPSTAALAFCLTVEYQDR